MYISEKEVFPTLFNRLKSRDKEKQRQKSLRVKSIKIPFHFIEESFQDT